MDFQAILKNKEVFYKTCNSLLVQCYYEHVCLANKNPTASKLNLRSIYSNSLQKDTIAPRYSTFLDYFSVYYPLLVDETIASIIRTIDSEQGRTAYKEAINRMEMGKVKGTLDISVGSQKKEKKRKKSGRASDNESELILSDLVLVLSDTQNPRYLYTGIVVKNAKSVCSIIVHPDVLSKLSNFKSTPDCFMVLVSNLTSNKREYLALDNMFGLRMGMSIVNPEVRKNTDILPQQSIQHIKPEKKDRYYEELNNSQKTAVATALKKRVTLIQGPPGTGKTRTVSCVISQCIQRGLRVLVCAPSKMGVDMLIESGSPWKCLFKKNTWAHISSIRSTSSSERPKVRITSENVNNSVEICIGSGKDKESERNAGIALAKKAMLVFCTLSMAGSSMLNNVFFDYVIIDEACQAIEPSVLIAIHKIKDRGKILLVGDPKQLPATIFSNSPDLSVSLFERLAESISPLLLNTQYRMHKKISKFPNDSFYSGKLLDGVDRDSKIPLAFVSTQSHTERKDQKSFYNESEINMITKMLPSVMKKYASVGIITPYKEQMNRLMSRDVLKKSNVLVSTIDGFQGQERDCIILSTVRTGRIGFLNDYRRMNVAITRAKKTIIVLGHPDLLSKDPIWSSFLSYIKEHNCIYQLEQLIKALSK
ncbi:regulator of nonsense transcripts 1 [Nematocida minor]|uniref:regulator of nonsense transcripts 1 n=1 Tax=Nematocida minor TaxID=1912983 RepID=UPI002220C93D|nr:regulator of nonsense transcripts 1 [Nematocida minor]KAI5189399.1 regulator of nonsense transcripts 1 [Nematocida minor]